MKNQRENILMKMENNMNDLFLNYNEVPGDNKAIKRAFLVSKGAWNISYSGHEKGFYFAFIGKLDLEDI